VLSPGCVRSGGLRRTPSGAIFESSLREEIRSRARCGDRPILLCQQDSFMGLGCRWQTKSQAVTFPILLFLFWSRYCLHSHYMATTLPLTAAESVPDREQGKVRGNRVGIAPEQGLVALGHVQQDEAITVFPAAVGRLPVELDVSVPVRKFHWRLAACSWPGASSK